MLKCGIYIRVSKDNMEQKTSLENQRYLLRKRIGRLLIFMLMLKVVLLPNEKN